MIGKVISLESPDSVATKARMLEGSIIYLLDDIVDACSEEGIPCSGTHRKRLVEEVMELTRLLNWYSSEANIPPQGVTFLERMVEELEGPEVEVCRLERLEQEFKSLLRQCLVS